MPDRPAGQPGMSLILAIGNPAAPPTFLATPIKPIELVIPPEAAKAFVRDMRAFFKAKGQLMQDDIAAKQVWLLKQHLPRGTKLRTSDVKELFHQMKDHTG
jgi:hypothetical protein